MIDVTRRTAFSLAAAATVAKANAAEPVTVGFAEALTGSLAAVGKAGILAMVKAASGKGGGR